MPKDYIFLDYLYLYPKKDIYFLAHILGKQLSKYLGEKGFTLLLDSKILLFISHTTELQSIREKSYQLHPAAKSLEYFLWKIIKRKKLNPQNYSALGAVFGNKNYSYLKTKFKNEKLILKTRYTWEFCRNEIMHFSEKKPNNGNLLNKYSDITDLIVELYEDLYGKTEPDEEIKSGFEKYFIGSLKQNKNDKKL
jgi:hypothetical protein